jgi:hypothetical protein
LIVCSNHQYQQNEQSHFTLIHWTQKNQEIWPWKCRSWLGTGTHISFRGNDWLRPRNMTLEM